MHFLLVSFPCLVVNCPFLLGQSARSIPVLASWTSLFHALATQHITRSLVLLRLNSPSFFVAGQVMSSSSPALPGLRASCLKLLMLLPELVFYALFRQTRNSLISCGRSVFLFSRGYPSPFLWCFFRIGTTVTWGFFRSINCLPTRIWMVSTNIGMWLDMNRSQPFSTHRKSR